MKKIGYFLMLFLASFLVVPTVDAQAPNTLTAKEKKQGWTLLFNGKDFSGWRQCNGKAMPANWTIDDQAMRVSLGEGKKPGQGQFRYLLLCT